MKQLIDTIKSNAPVRTVFIFSCALLVSSTVIFLSRKNDAVTVAEQKQTGILTSEDINVSFQGVGGKLLHKYVEESQFVKPGDILLELDNTDTKIAISKIKAGISQLNAQIEAETNSIAISTTKTITIQEQAWKQIEQSWAGVQSAKENFDNSKREFDRSAALVSDGSVSKSEHDAKVNILTKSKSAYIEALRQFDSLTIGADQSSLDKLKRTNVARGMKLNVIQEQLQEIQNRRFVVTSLKSQKLQLENELKQLEINLTRLTLRAPESGKIQRVLYKEGEMIQNSAPGVILESSRVYYDVYMNEKVVSHLKPNDHIVGHVSATNSNISGTIRFITPASSFADLRMTREKGQSDLTTYQVRVYITDIKNAKPGMTVEVDDANL